MKAIEKLALVRKSIETWNRKRDLAIQTLVRSDTKMRELRKTVQRLEKRIEREHNLGPLDLLPPRPEPEPALVEVTKVIEEAKKELPPRIDLLDIPDYLKRSKEAADKVAAEISAEIAEAKRNKATARALKVKGQVAERKAHAEIPKSKRRWDTNHSKWIEA